MGSIYTTLNPSILNGLENGDDTSPHTRAVRSGRVGAWVVGRGPVGRWALGNGPSAQAAAAYLFSALRSPSKEPQNFSNRRGRRVHSLHYLGWLKTTSERPQKGIFAPGKAFTSENEKSPILNFCLTSLLSLLLLESESIRRSLVRKLPGSSVAKRKNVAVVSWDSNRR